MSLVSVTITLGQQSSRDFDRFEAAVRAHPEILECHLMTGRADYLLRVEADDLSEFERIHQHILSRLPGVLGIQSSFVMRTIVLRPGAIGDIEKEGVAGKT